jgi:hypothetical protein
MSDIKVGDLVMVVRPTSCCGRPGKSMGRIFVVTVLDGGRRRCLQCGQISDGVIAGGDNVIPASVERLKRIDPPAEGDSFTVKLPKKQPVEA